MEASLLGVGFRRVLDTISDGVYVTTEEREIVYWSAGAERITGYSADDVVGKHCYDNVLVHTDLNGKQLCFDGCPLEDCIEHGIERTVTEVFLKSRDGRRLAVYVKTATFEEGGHTYGVEVFGELESVAGRELAAQVQELSDSSVTDELSGLFNRRYFDASLEQRFALFKRLGQRYGVLHLDIDEFKAINDSLGHKAGDDAIRFISTVLSSGARKMDVVSRYGGDEFAVVCSLSTANELEAYGTRLLTMVRDSHFAVAEDAGMRLSLSAGGTLVGSGDSDERSALERADAAMYTAKRAGRDRLAIHLAGEA
jgi:diguanylate cyclase (GGDEF)-like protein/PAS domain S-box-containing protein